VEFTDDISGKFDSESNQFVRGASSKSLFDIMIFWLDLNYLENDNYLCQASLLAVYSGMTCGRFWHRFAHFENIEFKLYFEVTKKVTNIIKLS